MCSRLGAAGYEQLELFTPVKLDKRRHILDESIDQLSDRFRKKAIFYAYSLMRAGTYLQQARYEGGHKGMY
ncbi:hypothetical protein L2D08_13055 [Domibacillus sp. PGB-M46]|uniref:hypothetical protein n=1 Tax=Domibacillus sp. PGB-M46 TaxID=2910255 RepID=UPI001F565C58|nr:hypothetical protein [Domibacillus sp. PGB-M46]MCI2255295.1 hypothetical protein [Domibacillus sp. PGB-M46]